MRSTQIFFSRWQNWLGLLLVVFFLFIAVAAPYLSAPNETTYGAIKKVGRQTDLTPHPPDEISPLGTLPGQLDVFHALVWGTREVMIFGTVVAFSAFIFGSVLGAIAGYAGGLANNIIMRVTDAFLAFPVVAGVVFIQQLVGMTIESMGGMYWFNNDYQGKMIYFEFTPPPFAVFLMEVDPLLISLVMFSWMPFARLVNTMVITLKNKEYIQASRALGANPIQIIFKHLLPNALGPAIVLVARDVGSSVILAATITFVGLGGQSSWGFLLAVGRNWIIGPGGDMLRTWWVFLPITIAIVLFGIAWNLLGDGLMEALEPTATRNGRFSFKTNL